MTTTIETELSLPEFNSEFVHSSLTEALPMLIAMRERRETIDFRPSPTDGLPTDMVSLKWYGFSRTDPKELGIWKFEQANHSSVYINSMPAPGGPNVSLRARMDRETQKPVGEVDEVRATECANMLRIITGEFIKAEHANRSPQRHRRIGSFFAHRAA